VLSKWYQGFVRYHGGDAADALPLLEEAHRLCTDSKIVFLMPIVGTSLGYTKALLGRRADAIADLERATQQARGMRHAYSIAWAACHLSYAYLAAGERDKARAALDEALRTSRAHGYRGVENVAQRLAAQIAPAEGRDPP
jgi:tetratricopeptide (TPR) repeat protein